MLPEKSAPASRGPSAPLHPDVSAPLSGWAVEQLRRVLRLEEGAGPTAEGRVRRRACHMVARVQNELSGTVAEPDRISDHLWSALLCEGRTSAARFFRPYQAGTGRTLWVRRSGGGAYPLARARVERLLEQLCRHPEDADMEPPRLFRNAQAQLHNGMSETALVRVLGLTSAGQTAILQRLVRGGIPA